jgi:hypothetical protein
MLNDPTRHEALLPLSWQEDRARESIGRIVRETEDRFSPDRYWPPHPRDVEGDEDPDHVATTLYYGACGVFWALHYLQTVGAATLSRSYLDDLDRLLSRNRAWLRSSGSLRRTVRGRVRRPPCCADRGQPRQPCARADVGLAWHPARGTLPARTHR